MRQECDERGPFIISRAVLVCAGGLWGILVGTAVGSTFGGFAGFVAFLPTMVLYPLLGAVVVTACSGLRDWAHEGNAPSLERAQRVAMAAFWPLVGCYALVVYPCVGVINRAFPDSD
jgi:hypothetical protein